MKHRGDKPRLLYSLNKLVKKDRTSSIINGDVSIFDKVGTENR